MKARLMYRNRDFDPKQVLPFGDNALMEDLTLAEIIKTMAGDDAVIRETARTAILSCLTLKDDILYRQAVLLDALRNPESVRKMYSLVLETLEKKRREHWWFRTGNLVYAFSSSIDLLYMMTKMLEKLRWIIDKEKTNFESEGFQNLFQLLDKELCDDWLEEVFIHLEELKRRDGMLIGAKLGDYCHGIGYVFLRKEKKRFRRNWWLAPSFAIAPRDEKGGKDLDRRIERAVNECTNVLAQATDHILDFFEMMRVELAFYVGCLNLADRLRAIGVPFCVPEFCNGERARSYEGLYDIGLALHNNTAPVGNKLNAKGKDLYIITGANQGGKTTFLRSMGQAQVLAQCGLFVPASRFYCPIASGIFTHFKREEDKQIESGKLDEELGRMSLIADHLKPGALLLFNESFASTNEREGSEIARQVTLALMDSGMEVFSVTHLYEYAAGFQKLNSKHVLHLRAERLEEGRRTFRIVPGQPLETGYGEDLYRQVFEMRKDHSHIANRG